jgi:hypothetical protein
MPQQMMADQEGGDQGVKVAERTRRSSLAAWHVDLASANGVLDPKSGIFVPNDEPEIVMAGGTEAAIEASLGIGQYGVPGHLSDIMRKPWDPALTDMPETVSGPTAEGVGGGIGLMAMDQAPPPVFILGDPIELSVIAAMPRRVVIGNPNAIRPLSVGEMRFIVLHVSEMLSHGDITEDGFQSVDERWDDDDSDMDIGGVAMHRVTIDPDAVIANLEAAGLVERCPAIVAKRSERTIAILLDAPPGNLREWKNILSRPEPDCSYRLTAKGVSLGQGVWGCDGGPVIPYGISGKASVRRTDNWPGDAAVVDAGMATADALLLAMGESGELDGGVFGDIMVDMARETVDNYRSSSRDADIGYLAAGMAICRMAETAWSLENMAMVIIEDPWGVDPGTDTPVTASGLMRFLESVADLRSELADRNVGPHYFDSEFRMSLTNVAAAARAFSIVGAMVKSSKSGSDLGNPESWDTILTGVDRDWLEKVNAEGEPAFSFASPHEIELKAGRIVSHWIMETENDPEGVLNAFSASIRRGV